MLNCEGAFHPNNLVCETICPPGLLKEDDLEGLCKTFCSEDTLVCTVRASGGSQEVNVLVGDQTIGVTQAFIYDPPMLYSVFPPELAAGSSSLLTGMFPLFWPLCSLFKVFPPSRPVSFPSSPPLPVCCFFLFAFAPSPCLRLLTFPVRRPRHPLLPARLLSILQQCIYLCCR